MNEGVINRLFGIAGKQRDMALLKILLSLGRTPYLDNLGLIYSLEDSSTNEAMLDLLLGDPGFRPHYSSYLLWAIKMHNLGRVKFFAQETDPSFDNNRALQTAVIINFPDAVEFLLADP